MLHFDWSPHRHVCFIIIGPIFNKELYHLLAETLVFEMFPRLYCPAKDTILCDISNTCIMWYIFGLNMGKFKDTQSDTINSCHYFYQPLKSHIS